MEKFERFIIESMKRRVFDVFFKNDKKLSENRKKEKNCKNEIYKL